MTIIIVCALAYYSYNAHREAALELTEDLLIAIDKRIATEVEAYLSPASRLVELVADLGARETFAVNEQSALEPLARQVLQTYEQLAMFNIADTNGNFIMPKKMPGGHIDTKLITRTDGKIDSRWLRRNATGEVIAIDPLPDDTYDPRERPWYTGATRSGGMYWTNVYIFYTDRKPGITAAYPITNAAGDNLGVMGIDIELGELCAFLDQLEIGDTGTPMIIDRHGMIVAFPDIQRMIQYDGGKPSTVNITDMGDPVLLRAYNTFQVEGPGHRELELDGRVYLNTVAALPDPFGRDWHVMIVVPADEFVGFVAENNRRNLMTSIAIVGFASLLALVMISQGLRADRNARAVQQHREQLEQQCEVFAALTAEQGYFDVPLSDACRVLATSAAPVIDADFVGIWAVRPNGDGLVCRCRYNRDNNGITDGAVLLRQDQPELLGAIAEGKVLDISDAARSKLTRRLPELDQQLNARSLLVCPVTLGQRVIGAVSRTRAPSGAIATTASVFAPGAPSASRSPGSPCTSCAAPLRTDAPGRSAVLRHSAMFLATVPLACAAGAFLALGLASLLWQAPVDRMAIGSVLSPLLWGLFAFWALMDRSFARPVIAMAAVVAAGALLVFP